MLEEKSNKAFEEIFNEWYKKFLEEEKLFNEEIKNAKMYRYVSIKCIDFKHQEMRDLHKLEETHWILLNLMKWSRKINLMQKKKKYFIINIP
jgi:hypothetical protein